VPVERGIPHGEARWPENADDTRRRSGGDAHPLFLRLIVSWNRQTKACYYLLTHALAQRSHLNMICQKAEVLVPLRYFIQWIDRPADVVVGIALQAWARDAGSIDLDSLDSNRIEGGSIVRGRFQDEHLTLGWLDAKGAKVLQVIGMRTVFGKHQLNAAAAANFEYHATAYCLQHTTTHRSLPHERAFVEQADFASDGDRVPVQLVSLAPYQHADFRPHASGEADVDGLLVADGADRSVACPHVE